MRRREHGDVLGRKPPPQLPEVRLDPTVLRREVVRDEQVPHSSACTSGLASLATSARRSRRPRRSAAQHACARRSSSSWPRYVAQRQLDLGIVAVGGVAEDDQRVPAEVPHGPVGDVPAAVTFEQRLVRRGEQIEHVDPTRGGGLVAATVRDDVRRAHLLALVASVEAVAQGRSRVAREHPRRLHEPGEAPTSIDDARGDDRAGRAPVDAPTARATPVVDRDVVRAQRSVGDHRAEHEPRALARQQDVGALAEPARGPLGMPPRGRRARCRPPPPAP